MREKRAGKTETLGYVLRRHILPLAVAAILLIASFSLQGIRRWSSARNPYLNPMGAPAPLNLTPVEFSVDDFADSLGTMLGETEPVGAEYFADALFIGDSLTDGIRIYEEFQGVRAVSTKGVNTHSALTEAFYDVGDGTKITMIDAIEYYKPRKVYIMLGTNGINWQTPEWNIDGFEAFLDAIITRVPGCYIVLQSIPPTTAQKAAQEPSYSIENIAYYNGLLRDLAVRKGIFFLDVHAALANEEGYLDDSIASGDGIHMRPAGYQIWYDYVATHAIEGESNFSISADGLLRFVLIQQQETQEPDEPVTDPDETTQTPPEPGESADGDPA